MMDGSPDGLDALQKRLGHRFNDPALLERALTHPSYLQQCPDIAEHNQRLEFLGDAVLGLILAEHLWETFPREREGVLTRHRAALARGDRLAEVARLLGLPAQIRLSDAEAANGGRDRHSILEDALEAVIGAIYLDGRYSAARDAVLRWYGDIGAHLRATAREHNPKGRLQERLQPTLGNDAIRYDVTDESGPDHLKAFTVSVSINGEVRGTGRGSSKKEAEEAAAREALDRMGE